MYRVHCNYSPKCRRHTRQHSRKAHVEPISEGLDIGDDVILRNIILSIQSVDPQLVRAKCEIDCPPFIDDTKLGLAGRYSIGRKGEVSRRRDGRGKL